jgi:hypothetical protein
LARIEGIEEKVLKSSALKERGIPLLIKSSIEANLL